MEPVGVTKVLRKPSPYNECVASVHYLPSIRLWWPQDAFSTLLVLLAHWESKSNYVNMWISTTWLFSQWLKGKKEGAMLRVRGTAFYVNVYSIYTGTYMGPMVRELFYAFYSSKGKPGVRLREDGLAERPPAWMPEITYLLQLTHSRLLL